MVLPIVRVRFNGGEPYRMILDPTVKEILLDQTLVSGTGMKVTKRGEMAEIDYYGPKEKVEVGYLESLELGVVKASVVRVLLIEGDDVTSAEGIKVYGRLGHDFLEGLRVTIFYPRKLCLLEASPPGDVPAGGVTFDLSRRFMEVPATVNDSLEGRFVIDPGASHTVVERRWARRNALVDKKATMVTLKTLALGGFLTARVPAVLEEMDKLPYKKNRPVGVLGATLLSRLALTYDFPRNLVWLRAVEGNE